MKKLIASDFDGTITAKGKREENVKAIAEWRREGNLFGVVTGRNHKSILHDIRELSVECDFLICSNGAVAWAFADDGEKRLFLRNYTASLLPSLMGYSRECGMREFGISTLMNDIFVRRELLERAHAAGRLDFSGDVLPVGIPWKVRRLKRVVQFTAAFESVEKSMDAAQKMRRRFDGMIEAYPSGEVLDCVASGVSKADGVSRVAEYFGIPHSCCFTVGDGHNDVSMLDAYSSFAVESALDEVKRHAKRTVSSVAEMIEMLW